MERNLLLTKMVYFALEKSAERSKRQGDEHEDEGGSSSQGTGSANHGLTLLEKAIREC